MHSLKKPGLLLILMLFLLIPLIMIGNAISDRISYKHEARASIANSWADRQFVRDPVLVIEYQVSGVTVNDDKTTSNWSYEKVAVFKAAQADFNNTLEVEQRQRGIYSIPVYTSRVSVDSEFEIGEFFTELQTKNQFKFINAYFVTTLTDPIGLEHNSITSIINETTTDTEPGTRALLNRQGFHSEVTLEQLNLDTPLKLNTSFTLRGTDLFRVTPNALNATVNINSGWPHPSFVGDILPLNREVLDSGFNANWEVTAYNRSVSSEPQIFYRNNDGYTDSNFTFGVKLFEPVDEYSLVNRATKYGLLMIILVFAGFYLFELLKGLQVHPVQYSLIGLALAIFFLMLLSLSEHLGFSPAYLIASLSSSGLISFYMRPFTSVKGSAFLMGLLLTTYLVCYLILFIEDHALLFGSILIFAGLSAVMLFTRKIDWYKFDAEAKLTSIARKSGSLSSDNLEQPA